MVFVEGPGGGGGRGIYYNWGLIKFWAPFGPLDYKEYGIIQTPKGPIILINPQLQEGTLRDFVLKSERS